jgi:hypothetical protein
MSKALRRRLAKLEARTNVAPMKPMFLIRRIIGPTGELCDWDRAETDEGEVWTRKSGESMQEFEDRVVKDLSNREISAFAIRVAFFPREEPTESTLADAKNTAAD